jgi:hypothetical protein
MDYERVTEPCEEVANTLPFCVDGQNKPVPPWSDPDALFVMCSGRC